MSYRARFVVPSGDSRVPLCCPFSSVNLDSKTKQNWRSGDEDLLSILQFRPLFYTSFGLITLVDSRYTWVPMLFIRNENITNRNYICIIQIPSFLWKYWIIKYCTAGFYMKTVLILIDYILNAREMRYL